MHGSSSTERATEWGVSAASHHYVWGSILSLAAPFHTCWVVLTVWDLQNLWSSYSVSLWQPEKKKHVRASAKYTWSSCWRWTLRNQWFRLWSIDKPRIKSTMRWNVFCAYWWHQQRNGMIKSKKSAGIVHTYVREFLDETLSTVFFHSVQYNSTEFSEKRWVGLGKVKHLGMIQHKSSTSIPKCCFGSWGEYVVILDEAAGWSLCVCGKEGGGGLNGLDYRTNASAIQQLGSTDCNISQIFDQKGRQGKK